MPTTRLALTVQLAGSPADGLLRVLTVLRRRGCTIVAVQFDAGDFAVVVDAPAARAHVVPRWVANVIGVSHVHERVRVEAA